MTDDLHGAVRSAWQMMAPVASWRGHPTGMHALDLLEVGGIVHRLVPTVVVVAGGLGDGGLALFLADCLDQNHRGKLLAGEKMGRERFATMPPHRRIQWVPVDLLVDDLRTAERLTERASPVLVVASPASLLDVRGLAGLVTPGSHLVVRGDTSVEASHYPEDRFLVDPTRDPLGLSACTWLLRVPS